MALDFDTWAESEIRYDGGEAPIPGKEAPLALVATGFAPTYQDASGALVLGDALTAQHFNWLVCDLFRKYRARRDGTTADTTVTSWAETEKTYAAADGNIPNRQQPGDEIVAAGFAPTFIDLGKQLVIGDALTAQHINWLFCDLYRMYRGVTVSGDTLTAFADIPREYRFYGRVYPSRAKPTQTKITDGFVPTYIGPDGQTVLGDAVEYSDVNSIFYNLYQAFNSL
ncbi:hypothetical protein KDF27_002327 [Salmonella enterica]|nr:hypothetical protein [Salmonella enterica]EHO4317618.1 hypothetical protein [Salmonella enterica]EHO8188990.1 hypothetical protein [Salmonella enterica]EHP5843326.1 hypothetical protein [Salmonella enterica]EIZ5279300.1 hypothetical protein [Salmonella enterica]